MIIFFISKIKFYNENSTLKSINYYSKTKLIAEKKLLIIKNNLIIRTNFTGFKNNIKLLLLDGFYTVFNIKKNQYLMISLLKLLMCFFIKNNFKLIKFNAKGY